jgi:hypothetical protein
VLLVHCRNKPRHNATFAHATEKYEQAASTLPAGLAIVCGLDDTCLPQGSPVRSMVTDLTDQLCFGGGIESSRRATKDVGYGPKTPRTGFSRRRMILRTSVAVPCRFSGYDHPPSCVAFSLAPRGDISSQGSRVLASAIPWCCVPDVRRQLQHPRPSADPSVPFLAKKCFEDAAPPPCRESICEYLVVEKTYRTAEREILVMVNGYYVFPKPSVRASR